MLPPRRCASRSPEPPLIGVISHCPAIIEQKVDEVDPDGRGLRLIRLYRMTPPRGPFEGALRVAAVSLPDGVERHFGVSRGS